MNESFENLLDAARLLPPVQQKRLAHKLLREIEPLPLPLTEAQLAALEAVEQTCGTIKGLDRETIIWLAEDEELCGY
ncbi:MAG: hypothetical protein SF097_08185 [Acidobacteriota bacterium]|nr:hypothetical protein [Acidobacteriota bacterium]